jgi:hypothetical protein
MAQHLRALAALPEDPCVISNTHMVAHSYLKLQSQWGKKHKKKKKKIPRPLLASMGTAPTEYTATFTGKNTQMHKYIFFKKVSVIKEETPDPCHWM